MNGSVSGDNADGNGHSGVSFFAGKDLVVSFALHIYCDGSLPDHTVPVCVDINAALLQPIATQSRFT